MTEKKTNIELMKVLYEAWDEPIHRGAPSADESVISDERLYLKLSLIFEEFAELVGAAYNPEAEKFLIKAWSELHEKKLDSQKDRDIVEIADAFTDLEVVINGAALEMGVPMDACFEEVHGSNMSKLDPKTGKAIRSDGTDGYPLNKVLKGPDYYAPNIKQILKDHGSDIDI